MAYNDKNNSNNYGNGNEDYRLDSGASDSQTSSSGTRSSGTGGSTSLEQMLGEHSEYKPNSGVDFNEQALVGEGKSTGSGAESALGTKYSWEKQGTQKAQTTYETDVLNAKQNLLANRQTMETNAVNYQTQADMMQYQNSQNAEKVGWTGGYVLDQNRQSEYLKQSIQAQMYGAMELQKYGHDSALAAARLSYDLNQQEYARQYYNDAVSAALSEAQLTGTYFSAETKDMMSQLAVADEKLKNLGALDENGRLREDFGGSSDPEYQQAIKIKQSIEGWFNSNGISREGIKTLEAWTQEQATELQWSQDLWQRYEAALKVADTKLAENSNMFIWLDENGNEIWNGINIKTGNWETMTGQDIVDYVKGNTTATNQYYSYLDSTLTGTVESGFKKWCISNEYISEDTNGNITINSKKSGNFTSLLYTYITQSGVINSVAKKFEGIDDDIIEELFYDWDFTFTLPDGTTKTMNFGELAGEQGNNNQNLGGSNNAANGAYSASFTTSTGNTYKYDWAVSSDKTDRAGYLNNTYYKTKLSNGKNICITTAARTVQEYWDEDKYNELLDKFGIKDKSIDGVMKASAGITESGMTDSDYLEMYGTNGTGWYDTSDIEINIFKGDSHTYNAEITGSEIKWDDNSDNNMAKEIQLLFQEVTGGEPEHGQIIVVGGTAYTYNRYSKIWSGIKGQCGSNAFKNAMKKCDQWAY